MLGCQGVLELVRLSVLDRRLLGCMGMDAHWVLVTMNMRTTPAILLLLVVARVRKLLLEPGLLCVSAT